MSADQWNWRMPTDLQAVSWDCAATAVGWSLRAMGLPWSEADVVAAMYPEYLNSTFGLLDSSGAGIVEWLASIGVSSSNNPDASFQEVLDAAGHQPMVIGGRSWNHWVAVRNRTDVLTFPESSALWIMNSAPGWCGIEQALYKDEFSQLGPFSAVWMQIPQGSA